MEMPSLKEPEFGAAVSPPRDLICARQRLFSVQKSVARVPVSLWGSGGEAVFAKCCVCVRNRSQPSATVGNRLRGRRKALLNGECSGTALEIESSGLAASQLQRGLQRRRQCE